MMESRNKPSALEPRQDTGTTFLSLPKDIRIDIYQKTGLVANPSIFYPTGSRPILLNMEFKPHVSHRSDKHICERNTFENLLFVSQTVHDEVLPLIYSANTFEIHQQGSGGLLSLFKLGTKALNSMGCLLVCVNECNTTSTYSGPCYVREIKRQGRGTRTRPLSVGDLDGLGALSSWKYFLKQLASVISPVSFNLKIICDVADLHTARRFAEPLLLLPKLAHCSVRFSSSVNQPLRILAESTVLKTVGREQKIHPFRFLDLPDELQWEILCHTDLNCPKGVEVLSDQAVLGGRECWEEFDPSGCPAHYAAFSSKPCGCWVFPMGIFQACHKLNDYATKVFYSNSFIVDHGSQTFNDKPRSHIHFLERLPVQSLRYLRKIEFHFLDLDVGNDLKLFRMMMPSWKEVVDFLYRKVNFQNLILRIVDNTYREFLDESGLELFLEGAERAAVEAIEWEMYQDLVAPLLRLRGLKDFSIQFNDSEWFERRNLQKEREKILENTVMTRTREA